MAPREHISETPATAFLRQHKITFSGYLYDYVDRGGTAESAAQLGVDEHRIIKTLVMQDQNAKPLIILMHGDRQVSLKKLARQVDAKKVEPCKPEVAQRHTGYQLGGTSPFAMRKLIPIYVERTILTLPSLLINGGRRGFLVEIAPQVLVDLLQAQPVDCAGTE
jgi:Cys-tRNA(Pro) deacylase